MAVERWLIMVKRCSGFVRWWWCGEDDDDMVLENSLLHSVSRCDSNRVQSFSPAADVVEAAKEVGEERDKVLC